jgi:hypothetical protein
MGLQNTNCSMRMGAMTMSFCGEKLLQFGEVGVKSHLQPKSHLSSQPFARIVHASVVVREKIEFCSKRLLSDFLVILKARVSPPAFIYTVLEADML